MRLNGYFDASMYVIVQSLSFVFLNKLCKNVDPVIALFAMSFIALITFNFMSLRQIKATYAACLNNKLLYLAMSVGLAADWVCMLYSSMLADPFVSMSGLFIFLAIVGFFRLFLKNKSRTNLFSVILLIISALVLYFGYRIDSSQSLGLGVILGSIAGIGFYVYIASSGELARRSQLSTVQVLATRFWLLFIGTAFFVPYQNLLPIILNNILPLILISFGSLIIPIYFNQQAIQKLGSTITAVCISFVPPVTYLFYVIYNQNINMINVIICLIITIALVLPYLARAK
jgi:drug/metabolite transporter (DMT)-like permease